MSRRRTLQDLADAAGLSLAATSYALRGVRGSPATILRVRQLADELGYTVDPIARALASGRTGSVGVSGSLRDLWQQDLSVMLTQALRRHGRYAMIADADADPSQERTIVEQFVAQRVDGAVVSPVDPSAAYWRLLDPAVAVVAIGDALTSRPGTGSVLFDNRYGVHTALAHLASFGHRRVGLLAPALTSTPGRPAEVLAVEVAGRLGLDLVAVAAPAATAEAVAVAAALLSDPARPTAVFCLSDSLAFAAYRAARDVGVRIPDELSVIGYDDHQLAGLVDPGLTTMAWDEDAIVDAAVGQLVGLLRDEAPGAPTFRPVLVVRGSTASPR
ncbi:putative LacI-family transcriptional regulator [Actinoplanes missouriensis 431]|uniref:Putative LacI-family transcriptional regulator n=1 Tax=Actinoplanes missouriensis (strain ATCC 14538 / DSM 43046 / CBS 188.64 / JCM 3121 / NBRC 102363 / NCIMB 12654 / NRRL B-3342 / UNCC 431) TaxID=512565 RepID=I0HBI8_ACTM4|nr:LacI family DNA-binding transcriptional regulator [Actinoplanes missouriensis]BAL90375.1 putative LacI-family transcriptional regulator [Actinoplanes missouriensis 431]